MTPVADTDLQAHADALFEAERTRVAVAPPSERSPELTVADAYAIQGLNVARHVAAGARVAGRKIGLTSAAMQRMLGVSEPDFGALLDHMVIEDGDALPVATLLQPKVEAELAFVMGEDLAGPGVDSVAAARAAAGVVPAIEVIDSRVADWRITLPDTIADNASSGRYVLGARVTPVDAHDLRLVGCVLTRNGDVAETGAGAAVLGNPLRCVAWLANALGAHGDGLRAGDVVLAGAVHAAVPVAAGDHVHVEFAHLGAVDVRFTGGDA